MNNNLAPIILFVYNRPWHTQQTVEALQKNELASESELFIYADGAKIEHDSKVQEVRTYIKTIVGFKTVTIIERDKNWGLADNVIDGVTAIVNEYGRIIVLEDDLVTSKGFLKYMNDALDMYEKEDRVMHVSGYMFPVAEQLPETFFYNTASCWGWGTWTSAWSSFNNDAEYLLNEIKNKSLQSKFNIENSYPFLNQLEANVNLELKTWAIKWYASFFLKEGYSLHPYPSLVNNIGHDGIGDNCGTTSVFNWNKIAEKIIVEEVKIIENKKARKEMVKFNLKISKTQNNTLSMFKNLIRKILPKRVIHLLKNIFNLKYREEVKLNVELNRIKKIPRFTLGETNLFEFNLKFVDSASFYFIYDEIFNRHIYNFKTHNTTPYIIDAGANIGLSIIYFKQLFPNAEIIAFEPDLEVLKVLEYNIKSFNFKNITLVKKALWDSEKTLTFMSEGADGGRIAIPSDKQQLISIQTIRLREFLKRKVDFLKIDIEGAETKVLEDCKDLLGNVSFMFVEFHSFVNSDQNLHQLLLILNQAEFRYYIQHVGIFSNQPFIKINDSLNMDLQLNIFAYK